MADRGRPLGEEASTNSSQTDEELGSPPQATGRGDGRAVWWGDADGEVVEGEADDDPDDDVELCGARVCNIR